MSQTAITVPTAQEWPPDEPSDGSIMDLDYRSARRLYFGRDPEDVKAIFGRAHIRAAAGEIAYMPDIPFQFYLLVLREYVLSPELLLGNGEKKSEAADVFLALIESALRSRSGKILPIMPDLLLAVDFIGRNQKKYVHRNFGNIYGNFAKRRRHIYTLVGSAQYQD